MELTETTTRLVRQVYEAMQAGSSGEHLMVSLFAPDGILVEPFTGAPRTHVGHEAIRQNFREATSMPRSPDFKLSVDRIWMEGDNVAADWTCTSSAMPAPLKGRDDFVIRDGKIARLEITIKPPMG
jgi:ketosteroid isomerase-like protein